MGTRNVAAGTRGQGSWLGTHVAADLARAASAARCPIAPRLVPVLPVRPLDASAAPRRCDGVMALWPGRAYWRDLPGDLTGPPVASAVAALQQDGICADLRLSEAVVAELQNYARSHSCYGGLDWRTRFSPDEQAAAERRTGQALLVGHFPDTDRACPAVGRLIDHPWLHAVANGYFGAPGIILDVRLWWSFASASPNRAA